MRRRRRLELARAGAQFLVVHEHVDALSEGMVLKPAVKYQRVAQTAGIPRRNH